MPYFQGASGASSGRRVSARRVCKSCNAASGICRRNGVAMAVMLASSRKGRLAWQREGGRASPQQHRTLISRVAQENRNQMKWLVGAPGFEPGNGGTKNRCLTAWRRPIRAALIAFKGRRREAPLPNTTRRGARPLPLKPQQPHSEIPQSR